MEQDTKWLVIYVMVYTDSPYNRTVKRELLQLKKYLAHADLKNTMCIYTIEKSLETESAVRKGEYDTVITEIKTTEGKTEARELYNFGNINLGNGDIFTLVLRNILGKTDFKYNKTAICFWNHGLGFGLFDNVVDDNSFNSVYPGSFSKAVQTNMKTQNLTLFLPNNRMKLIDNLLPSPKPNQPVEQSIDEFPVLNKMDMLTCDELALSLYEVFGEKKVDLLLMSTCFMQMLDDNYALKNVVQYYVAAESSLSFLGYDYQFLLKTLVGNPDVDLEVLVKEVIEIFPKKFMKNKTNNACLSWQIVSATKPAESEHVKELLDELVSLFLADKDYYFPKIIAARKGLTEMSTLNATPDRSKFYIVDIYEFLVALEKVVAGDKPEFSELLKRWLDGLDKIILQTFNGPQFIDPGQQHNFKGLSFYFPFDMSGIYNSYFYSKFYDTVSYTKSTLARLSYWSDFLPLLAKYGMLHSL